jgi:hypothetical protein
MLREVATDCPLGGRRRRCKRYWLDWHCWLPRHTAPNSRNDVRAARRPRNKRQRRGARGRSQCRRGQAHGGKVWIRPDHRPTWRAKNSPSGSSHAPAAEVTKKGNEERWPITFLAVFKKPPAKGPLTIEFMDKKEPGTLVDQYSTQTPGGARVPRALRPRHQQRLQQGPHVHHQGGPDHQEQVRFLRDRRSDAEVAKESTAHTEPEGRRGSNQRFGSHFSFLPLCSLCSLWLICSHLDLTLTQVSTPTAGR